MATQWIQSYLSKTNSSQDPGIIVRQHHTVQKQMPFLTEGTSAVLLQSGLDEKMVGGFHGNVTAFCEKNLDLLGDLENLFKDQSFHLVHWLNTTLFLRRTSQESISLERKSYLDFSSDTHCTRGEFGRVTYWFRTLRSWKRWTHLKSTRKDSMRER